MDDTEYDTLESLHEKIFSAMNGGIPRNFWFVSEKYKLKIYLRITSRSENGVLYNGTKNCIDVGSVELLNFPQDQKKGYFTRFLGGLEALGLSIFAENVQHKWLAEFLIRRGYKVLSVYDEEGCYVATLYKNAPAPVKDPDVVSVNVSTTCLESDPCQHGVEIVRADGTIESTRLCGTTIGKKYWNYLTPKLKAHFGSYLMPPKEK